LSVIAVKAWVWAKVWVFIVVLGRWGLFERECLEGSDFLLDPFNMTWSIVSIWSVVR
jgi:hypothetical protein